MKCSNLRVIAGQLAFDCPHCGFAYDADGNLIAQVWADYNGVIPCQQEGCGKEIFFPTLEESQALISSEATVELATEETADSPVPEPVPEAAVEAVIVKPRPALQRPVATAAAPGAATPPVKAGQIVFGFHGNKESVSLETTAKKAVHLAIKTILRQDCQRDGRDTFDQVVTEFLQGAGAENVTGVHPVSYADKEGKKDFGVVIAYRIV